MNNDELKKEIERKTGVPAILLTGETAKENIEQAKVLLTYRIKNQSLTQKTNREQFSDWWNDVQGIEVKDEAVEALDKIEAAAAAYPKAQDGGEVDPNHLPDPRPTREQFSDWIGPKMDLDPFKDSDGWKRMG